MRFFFFGTLMDADILSLVIGRTVNDGALRPARLPGFRRVAVKAATYPIILRDEGASVDGVIVDGISVRERALLEDYEGTRYRLVSRPIVFNEEPGHALVFEPVESAFESSGEDWDFERWRNQEKTRFMISVKRWKTADGRPDGG
jgi:hypothetical protein